MEWAIRLPTVKIGDVPVPFQSNPQGSSSKRERKHPAARGAGDAVGSVQRLTNVLVRRGGTRGCCNVPVRIERLGEQEA